MKKSKWQTDWHCILHYHFFADYYEQEENQRCVLVFPLREQVFYEFHMHDKVYIVLFFDNMLICFYTKPWLDDHQNVNLVTMIWTKCQVRT